MSLYGITRPQWVKWGWSPATLLSSEFLSDFLLLFIPVAAWVYCVIKYIYIHVYTSTLITVVWSQLQQVYHSFILWKWSSQVTILHMSVTTAVIACTKFWLDGIILHEWATHILRKFGWWNVKCTPGPFSHLCKVSDSERRNHILWCP